MRLLSGLPEGQPGGSELYRGQLRVKPLAMQQIMNCKQIFAVIAAGAILAACLVTRVNAEVPDTNSYWKNLSAAEKVAKRYLDDAMQSCRGLSGVEAEAALKNWNTVLQPTRYTGSEFNPCSGSGTLIFDRIRIAASDGRAIKLSENASLQTEWDFRARTINLWFGGDHISLSVSPISASVVKASLGSLTAQGKPGTSAAIISEERIVSGLEAFWRSAHVHYPKHSLFDISLQVIIGKDEGREMLNDFIRCGKSICE